MGAIHEETHTTYRNYVINMQGALINPPEHFNYVTLSPRVKHVQYSIVSNYVVFMLCH